MVISPRYGDYKDAVDTGARVRFNCFNSQQEVCHYGHLPMLWRRSVGGSSCFASIGKAARCLLFAQWFNSLLLSLSPVSQRGHLSCQHELDFCIVPGCSCLSASMSLASGLHRQ